MTARCPMCGAKYRHGDVLAQLRTFVAGRVRKEWTVADAAAEISCESKRLYNAIGYLARRGRILKTGYGRYRTISDIPVRQ